MIVTDAEAKVFVGGRRVRADRREDRRRPARHDDRRDRRAPTRFPSYADWRDALPGRRPDGAPGDRRRRLPALLVGHDRPAQGRAAHPGQPGRRARPLPRPHGLRLRLGQPGGHAAVPHRWRRLGAGRAGRRRHQRPRPRHRPDRPGRHHRARAHHPRASSCRWPCSSWWRCPGVEDRDFSALQHLPLRRVAHLRAGAVRLDPHLRVRVHAGLRAHRDHRLGRAAAGRRPRSRRARTATGCAPPACPTPSSEIRVVDSATGEDVPVGDVGEIWVGAPR